jgi:hypothetical protein
LNIGLSSPLTWELEFYNGVNGVAIAWVNIPSLALGTVFYVAYGDPTIFTFQGGAAGAACDTNYGSDACQSQFGQL